MSRHHRTEQFVGGLQRDQGDLIQQVVTYPNVKHSSLYISSENKVDGTSSNALYQNDSKLVKQDISKIGLKSFHLDYCISNVNEKNNTFRFLSYPDGAPTPTIYTRTIDPKNYTDDPLGPPGNAIQSLFTDIITSFNGSEGDGQPNTFSFSISDCVVTFTSTGTFQFVDCPAINFGNSCHGLFYTNSPVTSSESMKVVPRLQYTSYIDVSEIGNARITNDTFTGTQLFNLNDHFARIFVDTTTALPRVIDREIQNIQFIPYRHRALTSFQVTLYDEYSTVLYSETQTIGTDLVEVPLVQYELKFNLIS